MGGDEFAVILTNVKNIDDIGPVAQKLSRAASEPFDIDDRQLYISTSIGISLYPDDGDGEEKILKNADSAMYQAKEQGRNTHRFYSREANEKSLQRMLMLTLLRRAVEREEFWLMYQPQIDIESGRITGLEALVRWENEEVGSVPPDIFIPLAEECGVILPLGEWICRSACQQGRMWRDSGLHELQIAINLSAHQFNQSDIVDTLETIIDETGTGAANVEVELTESMLMKNVDSTIATLNRIKSMGLSIAIDDFGTGYSSLSYLATFPIDRLKIDRSFVRYVPGNQGNAEIVSSIIALGQSLNLRVIAEGVETEQQVSFLSERGCRSFQGYLYSPPMKPEMVPDFIRNFDPSKS